MTHQEKLNLWNKHKEILKDFGRGESENGIDSDLAFLYTAGFISDEEMESVWEDWEHQEYKEKALLELSEKIRARYLNKEEKLKLFEKCLPLMQEAIKNGVSHSRFASFIASGDSVSYVGIQISLERYCTLKSAMKELAKTF